MAECAEKDSYTLMPETKGPIRMPVGHFAPALFMCFFPLVIKVLTIDHLVQVILFAFKRLVVKKQALVNIIYALKRPSSPQ